VRGGTCDCIVTLGVPALVAETVGAQGARALALAARGQRQKLQALGVHLANVIQVVSNCQQSQFDHGGLQLKVIVGESQCDIQLWNSA
jgi:hypothetical protein